MGLGLKKTLNLTLRKLDSRALYVDIKYVGFESTATVDKLDST